MAASVGSLNHPLRQNSFTDCRNAACRNALVRTFLPRKRMQACMANSVNTLNSFEVHRKSLELNTLFAQRIDEYFQNSAEE